MNYVVDDIGKVVAAMRGLDEDGNPNEKPYYMYGHRVEINSRLLAKNNNKDSKYKKYPLIALRLDTPEYNKGGLIHYNLNIAIIDFTKENYNAEDRYEKVFKPILYPLYKKFLLQLKNSGLFMWDDIGFRPEHTKIDRPFWGTDGGEGNVKRIFNDPLDAIEIIDLKINQRIKC